MDIEVFFEKLFINSELADKICEDLNLKREQYSRLSNQLSLEREKEIKEIQRIRSLYHNKKNLNGFRFPDFSSFYKWYKHQHELQRGECYYCKVDEKVIATLFQKKYQNRKRLNRGNHLEIERKDALKNTYDSINCVLVCYFCNNDKSDIFNEYEYLEYLKDRKRFLNSQYEEINRMP